MAANTGDSGDGTRWEGYSNYQQVSKSIAETVRSAVNAYSVLQGEMSETGSVDPDLASAAKSDIMAAAIPLLVEMEEEKKRDVEEYDEILARWKNSDEAAEDDEDDAEGYITKLHTTKLTDEMPSWMFQFIRDIRRAAWSLGYMQAGRRGEETPDELSEDDVKRFLKGM